MLTSLQALLRLATLRWLGVFICALATLLATTSTASALEPAQTKTRVWGFDFAENNSAVLLRAVSPRTHLENRSSSAEAVSGSLLAARGGGGTIELFHGTTSAGARSILSEGLLPVSRNTAPFPAGSFFTHAGQEGAVAASHWAARSAPLHGGSPALLRGTMSQELFNTLSAQGLIRTGPVPGLPFFPAQTVILPEGLGAASSGIQWSLVPLTF